MYFLKRMKINPILVMTICVIAAALTTYLSLEDDNPILTYLNAPLDLEKFNPLTPELVEPVLEPPVPIDQNTEPPVPIKITAFDSVVQISHFTPEGRIVGGGVLLKHQDATFVLTSSMVFPELVGTIAVTGDDGITRVADFIADSEETGLAALYVHDVGSLPSTSLNNDPNLPPEAEASCYQPGRGVYTSKVLAHMRKHRDWMVMDGGIPGTFTGAPLIGNEDLVVGIVVGVNNINPDQSIVAGNRALMRFSDAVVAKALEATIEETEDVVQENN